MKTNNTINQIEFDGSHFRKIENFFLRDEIKKAIEHQKDCNRFIQLVLEKNIGSFGFDIKNAVDMIKIEGM